VDLRQARQIDLRENGKHGRELSSYEYLLVLLQMGASIEHALMVQYLYAAYSLRDDVEEAREWRETLLLIAREEMGHLLTVQNVLALLGGPINIDREDYPWDTPFQAFPFQLQRLTRGSLACYCYAEMPVGLEKDPGFAEIWEEAKKHVNVKQEQPIEVNHVGKLYHHIIEILGNRKEIPDHCFVDAAYGQMSWDDWGRSYRGDPPPKATSSLASAQSGMDRANLFISKVTTREQAILALAELSEQGEGLVAVDKLLGGSEILQAVRARASARKMEQSHTHYGRFRKMYDELCKYESRPDHSSFSWDVPSNPSSDYSEQRRSAQDKTAVATTKIENRLSRRWAGLFNIRYRMLLTWLLHALILTRKHPPPATAHLRGQIIHRVFGEMYNLKAIAEILVKLPLKEGQDRTDGPRAGPPFQMPFRLTLPPNERDTWRIHEQAIKTSLKLCKKLLGEKDDEEHEEDDEKHGKDHDKHHDKHGTGVECDPAARSYLAILKQADEDARFWVRNVFDGLR
jgi:hypothetical protein